MTKRLMTITPSCLILVAYGESFGQASFSLTKVNNSNYSYDLVAWKVGQAPANVSFNQQFTPSGAGNYMMYITSNGEKTATRSGNTAKTKLGQYNSRVTSTLVQMRSFTAWNETKCAVGGSNRARSNMNLNGSMNFKTVRDEPGSSLYGHRGGIYVHLRMVTTGTNVNVTSAGSPEINLRMSDVPVTCEWLGNKWELKVDGVTRDTGRTVEYKSPTNGRIARGYSNGENHSSSANMMLGSFHQDGNGGTSKLDYKYTVSFR